MTRFDRIARYVGYVLVALAALVVLGATSEVQAVFDCLPKQNCQSVEECCRKPRVEFWLQLARAEMRRDFYNSRKNRDEAFGKGAWDSPNALEAAFMTFISTQQDAAAKKRLKIKSQKQFDDVPEMTTHPDCTTSVDANNSKLSAKDVPGLFDDPNHPLTKANVCKEAVVAAIRHEQAHQERCQAEKARLIPPRAAEGGWARRELDISADKERDAYAREAAVLRQFRRQARRRCSAAQALADDNFENAKQKVQALKLMRQPRTW